jgi:hypothetical protein
LTPLSLAIFKFLDSLLILFFPFILYAIRCTSSQTLSFTQILHLPHVYNYVNFGR